MTPISRRKADLEARLALLQSRLTHIDAELDSHLTQDSEESAVEHEDDEVLEGMGVSGQQEMAMIEAALARIVAGDYGICAKCGGHISDARLDVLPYTPFCRNCAA